MRRNADESLRDLERAAAAGDPAANDRFVQALLRVGRAGEITLGSLAALPHPTARRALEAVPMELRAAIVAAMLSENEQRELAWAGRPAYQPMTHEQILRTFRENRHDTWAREWEQAVDEEADALAAGPSGRVPRRRPADALERAQRQGAETVSEFLGAPRNLEAYEFFGYRAILGKAWATAERLRDVLTAATASASATPPAPPAVPRRAGVAMMLLGDLGVRDWPRDERSVLMGTISVANLGGGPAATEESLPFFTVGAARDALAHAIRRGHLNPQGQELVRSIVARLPEEVVTCDCAHSILFHGPGDLPCRGTGADMDPVYRVAPEERCACAGLSFADE